MGGEGELDLGGVGGEGHIIKTCYTKSNKLVNIYIKDKTKLFSDLFMHAMEHVHSQTDRHTHTETIHKHTKIKIGLTK